MKSMLTIKLGLSGFLLLGLASISSLQAATIDILMLYTPESSSTQVNQYIAEANRVYKNNGIDIQLNSVGAYSVNQTVSPSSGWLSALANSSSVQGLRDNVRADMVSLLGSSEQQGNGSFTCGIGYIGYGNEAVVNDRSMYSISAGTCGANTFIHELGHNMGLGHSKRQGSSGGVFREAGVGYGVDNGFATIMAYPQAFGRNTQRISAFSNPQRYDCANLRCSDGVANAKQSIARVAESIADFR